MCPACKGYMSLMKWSCSHTPQNRFAGYIHKLMFCRKVQVMCSNSCSVNKTHVLRTSSCSVHKMHVRCMRNACSVRTNLIENEFLVYKTFVLHTQHACMHGRMAFYFHINYQGWAIGSCCTVFLLLAHPAHHAHYKVVDWFMELTGRIFSPTHHGQCFSMPLLQQTNVKYTQKQSVQIRPTFIAHW